jgi:hypothetical protein
MISITFLFGSKGHTLNSYWQTSEKVSKSPALDHTNNHQPRKNRETVCPVNRQRRRGLSARIETCDAVVACLSSSQPLPVTITFLVIMPLLSPSPLPTSHHQHPLPLKLHLALLVMRPPEGSFAMRSPPGFGSGTFE